MFSNPNLCIKSEFQFRLFNRFLSDEARYDKNEVALFLDRAPDTIHRWCNCTNPIPVDMAKKVIEFIHSKDLRDTWLLEFFCSPHYLPIPIIKPKISKKTRQVKEIDLPIFVGEALKELENAYQDEKIEKKEYKAIHAPLTKIRQVAAELDEVVRKDIK